MPENKFHEDFPEILQVHPQTKEKIKPIKVISLSAEGLARSSVVQIPEFVHEKNAQLGITQDNPTMLIEEAGWRLNVIDTNNVGLVISSVFYQEVFFIFNLLLPWLAIGTPCRFEHQYFLERKIARPFVYIFADGFLVWARYGFGHFSTLDQAYYFLADGTCYPLIQLTSPAVLSFVPLYIDFDIINTANTVYNYYPHIPSGLNFHLAVTDFSRIGGGSTPAGENYNIRIENSISGLSASARVSFNAPDNSIQYVTTWLGYNMQIHPLRNLRGVEIVNRDIVYVYLMQNISTGLYGPKIELNLETFA